jgi:tetratricopeptide (TPR) repeat protein
MTASNRYPDEAFGFVQLATVQLAEGNPQRALKAAERAVELDPSLPDAYLVRGAVRRMLDQPDASREDLQRASQAPAELPMFLFGSAYDSMDSAGFSSSIMDLVGGSPEEAGAGGAGGFDPSSFAGFPGMPSMPGMPGMDPMKMMGQIFDSDGNIRGPFKPLIRMALKNAPSILKNMPPSMLKNMGGVDPEMLKQANLDEMTPEALEAQMKAFYKMMQSGEDPMEMVRKAQEELDGKKKP